MEGLTPTQQQDEEQDNPVGDPGPTQRSSSGGGATGSVEEGTVHRNTFATVSASSSRSVKFPEVESQALDGDHRQSGRGGHGSRRNTRTSPGSKKEGVQIGTTATKPTPPNMSHPRNVTKIHPARNLGPPHRRVEGVRISRRQGRGGITASWWFLTGHHRLPGDR